jgi:hypothetical protein
LHYGNKSFINTNGSDASYCHVHVNSLFALIVVFLLFAVLFLTFAINFFIFIAPHFLGNLCTYWLFLYRYLRLRKMFKIAAKVLTPVIWYHILQSIFAWHCRVLDHPMQKDFWTRLHRGLATIIRIVSEIFRIIIDKFSLIVSSTWFC